MRKYEVDNGTRDGVTTAEKERVKSSEREVKVLRQVNEILRLASAFFAQAEQVPKVRAKDGTAVGGGQPVMLVAPIPISGW